MQGTVPEPTTTDANTLDSRCALCGMTPAPNEDGALRELGAAPVVITVCADADGCVTRWMSGGR
jgi:hypothetical protein